MLAGRGLPVRRMDEVWPAVGPIRRRVVGERVTDAPQRVVGLEGEVVGKPAQPVDEGEHVGDAVPSLGWMLVDPRQLGLQRPEVTCVYAGQHSVYAGGTP